MADPKDLTWRVGHNIPRNLYEGDQDVGRMDTPELARRVVDAMNAGSLPAHLMELAARAEAVGLLERCRVALGEAHRDELRRDTLYPLEADLDAFLGSAPEDPAPLGGHVADLSLRALQAALEASQALLRESRSALEAYGATSGASRDLRERITSVLGTEQNMECRWCDLRPGTRVVPLCLECLERIGG
jgi:hypothetical protein